MMAEGSRYAAFDRSSQPASKSTSRAPSLLHAVAEHGKQPVDAKPDDNFIIECAPRLAERQHGNVEAR